MSASQPCSLPENVGLAFIGEPAWPAAQLAPREAKAFASARNPSGRPNADVLRDFIGLVAGKITEQTQIDFPLHFTEQEAALYQGPFKKLRATQEIGGSSDSVGSGRRPCLPAPTDGAPVTRAATPQARRPVATADHRSPESGGESSWWISPHANAELRTALARLERYLATPVDAAIPAWNWIDSHTLPDATLLAVARDDDYTSGVLHSRIFHCWWRQHWSPLSPSEIVASFPFPWPPTTLLSALNRNQEELRHALARATRSENQEQINATVSAAYGWSHDLTDDEILSQLINLNHERFRLRRART